MAKIEKTKLEEEIEDKIQSLNLLLSTIQADHSRKPETVNQYKKQYEEILRVKKSKR